MPRASMLGYHFAIGDDGVVSFELTGRTTYHFDVYSICILKYQRWSMSLSID